MDVFELKQTVINYNSFLENGVKVQICIEKGFVFTDPVPLDFSCAYFLSYSEKQAKFN